MSNNNIPITAQFLDTYYPIVDGVVRTVDNYAKILNKESYSCVIVPQQDDNYVDNFPYDVIRAKSLKLFVKEYRIPVAGLTRQIKETLDSKDIKILHTHSPFFIAHYALKQGKKRGIKVVSTFHSKYYDDALVMTKSKLLANFVKNYVVRFYNKCDSVWACSSSTAETLRSYGYKGEIFVAENGTDYIYPSNPDELRESAKKLYGLSNDIPTILFVGHQIWQKNLALVLDTANVLNKRNYKFRMLIVGTGYAQEEISKYASELGLDSNVVTFIRKTQNMEQLQAIELASDLFFFPSIYDNAPLVLRETAAMKLPAILMNGSNAAEPVKDGENGYLCENDPEKAADKIQSILENREKLKAVGEEAQRTIGKSWSEIMPSIIKKYNEIIDKA